MRHDVVQREPMTVVGVEIRTANDRAAEIGQLWGRFLGERLADGIAGRLDEATVAVYRDYEGDHTRPYSFLLGCRVAPVSVAPEGMVRREIPGGTFTRVLAEGEQPQTLIQAWMEIWQSSIARSFASDYEIHAAEAPERVEIYLSTRPESR